MKCYKCGNPMTDDAKFCNACGTPVPVQPPVEPTFTVIPYEPARMEGGNIIIPQGRKFRILCPDCRRVSEDIKRDQSAGYACPVCKKAYAYMGQILFYRMGSFYPLYAAHTVNVVIDGFEYGRIAGQESVRVLVSPGSHIVTMGGYGLQRPTQYKVDITPENNTYAFKFNLIYNGPFTYPGRGTSNELKPCRPEDIPNI